MGFSKGSVGLNTPIFRLVENALLCSISLPEEPALGTVIVVDADVFGHVQV